MSFDQVYVQTPVVFWSTGAWDADSIRELGGAVYDPVTGSWMLPYTGRVAGGSSYLGAVLSDDGDVWTAHPQNPLSGATLGEDPYLVKNEDGSLYRDGAGLAYLYCEEKVSVTGHRGVDLWRSGANVLTGWTRYGRVLDKGASGWDVNDRTSPTCIHDGSQFVMLYEGRGVGQEGEVGYATSADGLAFTAAAAPIVVRGAGGTWNDVAVVPDDLIKIGTTWVLLVHGSADGTVFNAIGRYSTTDDPADWDASSFTAMTGNPFDTVTETLQCFGNDHAQVLWLDPLRHQYRRGLVVPA